MTQLLVMSDLPMSTPPLSQGPEDDGQRFDVALLVPSWSEPDEWIGRTHIYVHQRPKATGEGARVWLCQHRKLFYSYRVDGFVELAEVLPSGGTGPEGGWAMQVSDGRPAKLSLDAIDDPEGVATRWSQGFRYLAAGGTAFVRAPRPSRAKAAKQVKTAAAPATPQRRRFGKGRRSYDKT